MQLDITRAIVIKDGNLFFLTAENGFVPLEVGHGFGLYHNDCRFLDGYELTLAGRNSELRESNAEAGNAAILIFSNSDSPIASQRFGSNLARACDLRRKTDSVGNNNVAEPNERSPSLSAFVSFHRTLRGYFRCARNSATEARNSLLAAVG